MGTNQTLRRGALWLYALVTGRNILASLNELNRTQWLAYDELMVLQRAKLLRLIDYAYQYVPYYRKLFNTSGLHPDDLHKDLACMDQLPILTKEMVREHWNELLTTEPKRRQRLSKLSTSGSTGLPLIFMQDDDFRDAVTADIQRHMGWAGWKFGELQAVIWGAPFKPDLRRKLRTRMIDWVWNRLQINAFLMSDNAMLAFAKQVHRHKPRILFGYASSLHRFAQFVQDSPYRGITFEGIFSGAELLLPSVCEDLERVFNCQVYNHYGTNELGGVACECEAHTGLHISVENSYVEILNQGRPTRAGEIGELIITNLNNLGMPFIRYNIGDGAAWQDNRTCPCGRASPRLSSVDGRRADAFRTRDGRYIWTGFTGAAFRCLVHPTIRQFQIVQKSLDQIVVRLVKVGDVPKSSLEEISRTIQATFGEGVMVSFEYPQEIPLLPSGKHQYAISEVL
jgi:phenylacetate-CoA ligase